MPQRTRTWCVAVGLMVWCGAAQAADPGWYRRQASWSDTMLASLTALQEQTAKGEVGPRWSPWQVLGPLFAPAGQRSYPTVYPPESKVDLQAAVDNGKGRAAKWTAKPEYVDGQIHDLPSGDQSATFLYRTVTVPAAAKQPIYLGSDDGLTVWFNGRQVLGRDVPRGCSPNSDTVTLDLQPGENRLLLKISNLTGGYAFYFATSPTPAASLALEQLWGFLRRDFREPAQRRQIAWEQEDRIWLEKADARDLRATAGRYLAATKQPTLAAEAGRLAGEVRDAAGLWRVQALYHRSKALDEAGARLQAANLEGLRLAIDDLAATHGERYAGAAGYRDRLTALDRDLAEHQAGRLAETRTLALVDQIDALRREALLANPLLDGLRVLLVKRRGGGGLPANWQGNSSIGSRGYDNELAILSPARPDGTLTTLFRPADKQFVGDLDLHFNADRLLFSMPGENGAWQVFEIRTDGTGLRQVTPGDQPDVQAFDGCYLPDGRILFCSTACYQGVPCVGGSDKVSLIYQLDPATGKVRQLTFDQDHSWDPVVLNNGRVLYARWEYSDTPHYFTRLLFHMNPDGTEQQEYYGSNSYWPNSMFYSRPLPGSPTRVVTIVSGHHGVRREGELLILDPAQERREARGVVQRIPGRGQPVEPKIVDQLVEHTWPRFLHPAPLGDKQFLVSCRPTPRDPAGIWLADVYDNLVLLKDDPDYALFEPVPLVARPTPPVIPDKVKLDRTDATVYLADVYAGPGLAGVPRGTVKRLRVYADHFAYPGMGGHQQIGIDGPWDVKRILGTVPVETDGSAMFTVPANLPLAVQPLDADGQALQVMRSWMTAMPGETLSCVGCHESQNTAPPRRRTIASAQPPKPLEPFYGPARGYSFRRDVQPVLDRFCVGCHDGTAGRPDLRDPRPADARGFSPSYLALHPYVRRPGPESDYHLQVPTEFQADTSELVQMLRQGHHEVRLDQEGWDRLICWIDLNVPCLGTWSEDKPIPGQGRERRATLRALYANLTDDWEQPGPAPAPVVALLPPIARAVTAPAPAPAGWPFDAAEARRRQEAAGPPSQTIDLGDGVTIDLVKVPAGEFVMGTGEAARRVTVARPFWMAKTEVTNAQFARFDPTHDSGYISETNKDQIRRGVPVNGPRQPVIRVSAERAEAFCRWLSERSGRRVRLPAEAEWEWACRAGSAGPTWYGDLTADFAPFANLADHALLGLARANSPKWHLRVDNVNDGVLATADVGRYQPNPWGLQDVIGNVAEWTADGEDGPGGRRRIVRGGSWYDRPHRATAAFRLSYPAWRPVYNVGFRVAVEVTP